MAWDKLHAVPIDSASNRSKAVQRKGVTTGLKSCVKSLYLAQGKAHVKVNGNDPVKTSWQWEREKGSLGADVFE